MPTDASLLHESILLQCLIRDIWRNPACVCNCGEPPYVDGEPCPTCFASQIAEEMEPIWKERQRSALVRFKKHRKAKNAD